jgi:hypothetical protein
MAKYTTAGEGNKAGKNSSFVPALSESRRGRIAASVTAIRAISSQFG